MPFSTFHHVRIAGISTVVPREETSLDDEIGMHGGDAKKVARMKKIVGLDKRRVAPEGITPSDLCIQAAERLLASTGVNRSSIDGLFFVTQAPDYPAPASAFIQHHALGLSADCAAFDVNLGCAGYVYGLWLAAGMLESQACSRILLLVGDGAFRTLPLTNRVTTPIFGDAGTATLLEHREKASPLSFSIGSDGSGYESLIRPGGGARIPHIPDSAIATRYNEIVRDHLGAPWTVGGFGNTYMDGMKIFQFTMDVIPAHILDHMSRAGLTPDDVDWLVLHQANKQIILNLAEKAGFPLEKAPWKTFSKFGNQASASIPGAICDQLKVICDANEPLRILLCGYGIGLTWASCYGDFTGMHCCGVHDFVPPEHVRTDAEHIEYWHKKFMGE